MAKTKKRKTTTRRKGRRRMGAMKKPANLETALYALGGAILVKFGSGKLFDMVDPNAKIKPALRGAIIAGLGYAAPMVIKNNKMVEDISLGIMVAGGITVAQGMGWISGIDDNSAPLIAAYENMKKQLTNGSNAPMRQTTTGPSIAGYGDRARRGSRYSSSHR